MLNTRTARIIGWVLTALLAALFMGPSALGKLTEWEGKAEAFGKLGFTTELMARIGILEIVIAIVFVIPRSALVGAILLTGYLGGATLAHLRVGEPIFGPIVIGVLVWVALGLRQPVIFRLGVRKPPAN